MNIYSCRDCEERADGPRCVYCGSYNIEALGPLHLVALGLDVYVSIVELPDGPILLIQKPSGQAWVEIDNTDFLGGQDE